jgi:hypothetical protein
MLYPAHISRKAKRQQMTKAAKLSETEAQWFHFRLWWFFAKVPPHSPHNPVICMLGRIMWKKVETLHARIEDRESGSGKED